MKLDILEVARIQSRILGGQMFALAETLSIIYQIFSLAMSQFFRLALTVHNSWVVQLFHEQSFSSKWTAAAYET